MERRAPKAKLQLDPKQAETRTVSRTEASPSSFPEIEPLDPQGPEQQRLPGEVWRRTAGIGVGAGSQKKRILEFFLQLLARGRHPRFGVRRRLFIGPKRQ